MPRQEPEPNRVRGAEWVRRPERGAVRQPRAQYEPCPERERRAIPELIEEP